MKGKTFFFLVRFFLIILPSCFHFSVSFAQPYFQQQVNIEIHVILNDVEHELSATERMEYTNHSPVALNELYVHLWANGYRNEHSALAKQFYGQGDPVMLNASKKERGFIDSLDFKVDGVKTVWEFLQDTMDVCKLKLNRPLMPGEKMTITTPFHVKIPSASISRLGYAGQAYSVTQWFPKPAVFDRNGWNYFSYLDQGEFYSEFGTYDVFITLPENYVVGATGDLVDGSKELLWLENKAKETKSSESFSDDMSFPPSSSETKTLHYHQENVHDFAWFADKRFHVLKEEIELPVSKRKVTAWLMFTNAEAEYWKQGMDYTRYSIQNFSKWIGEYPYQTITAVDVATAAGSGMEYPGIFTAGNYGSPFELEVTMAHEIGHNWFYGILGSNERAHPWMDEGLTNFLESRYFYSRYTKDEAKLNEGFVVSSWLTRHLGLDRLNHRKIQYLDYLMGARRNTGQPPETRADQVTYSNYRGDVYYKTSLSFDLLKSYVGDSVFDACMHRYFEEWKFRHPQPEDMKKSFVTSSGKNLDWLFDDLITTTKQLDYKIDAAKPAEDKKTYVLTITNSGRVAAPFSISGFKNHQVQKTEWLEGFEKKQVVSLACEQCDEFRIDAEENLPELDQSNNTIRTSGLLKKTEPVHFQFLGGVENPSQTQIFYAPVIGWNKYNKTMAGAAIYNVFIPEKKFEYVAMPLYAMGTKDFAGGGKMTYNMYPDQSKVHKISVSFGAQTYSYLHDSYENDAGTSISSVLQYAKYDSRISLSILPPDRWKKLKYGIIVRNVTIHKEVPYSYQYKPSSKTISIYELTLNRNQFNKINPTNLNFRVRANENLFLASIEEQFKISYRDIDKGFYVRLFAGNIFYRNTGLQGEDYRFQLSGYSGDDDGYFGEDDYLFDEVFLGRTETTGIAAQQFVASEGGFAMPTYSYRLANKWMLTMNLKTSIPGILPVRLFADIGTFDDAKELTNGSSFSFDMGVEVNIIKNIFTIYFPLAYSDDIQYVVDNENLNYGNLIRFELHLNKLNPLELIRQIEF